MPPGADHNTVTACVHAGCRPRLHGRVRGQGLSARRCACNGHVCSPLCVLSLHDLMRRSDPGGTPSNRRRKTTPSVDFRDEATSFHLRADGKACIEFVLAVEANLGVR